MAGTVITIANFILQMRELRVGKMMSPVQHLRAIKWENEGNGGKNMPF